jgi:hypothetical protein
MASKDFLPGGGAALLSFARNYSDHIWADPGSFGISEPVAAQLADLTADYAAFTSLPSGTTRVAWARAARPSRPSSASTGRSSGRHNAGV